MRNFDEHTHTEFGKESVILSKMERLVSKMADFGNKRRFTLRWLGAGISLVSVKLKNTIRTS